MAGPLSRLRTWLAQGLHAPRNWTTDTDHTTRETDTAQALRDYLRALPERANPPATEAEPEPDH